MCILNYIITSIIVKSDLGFNSSPLSLLKKLKMKKNMEGKGRGMEGIWKRGEVKGIQVILEKS